MDINTAIERIENSIASNESIMANIRTRIDILSVFKGDVAPTVLFRKQSDIVNYSTALGENTANRNALFFLKKIKEAKENEN